jgi:hypothetical protein
LMRSSPTCADSRRPNDHMGRRMPESLRGGYPDIAVQFAPAGCTRSGSQDRLSVGRTTHSLNCKSRMPATGRGTFRPT